MADEVKITMTADDSNAQTAMQRQIALAKALEGQLDKLALKAEQAASKDTGKDMLGNFAKTLTAFVGVGTLVQGWQTAVSLLTAELDGAIARQEKAANTFTGLAGGQAQLFFNLGDDKSLGATVEDQRRRLQQEILKISESTQVKPSKVQAVVDAALAAKQGEDTALTALTYSELATKSAINDPSLAAVIAPGAMGLAAGNKEITPEMATGFMLSVNTALPLANTKDVAVNLPRVINAGRARDTAENVSAGMFSAATIAGGDTTGDKGTTFFIKLMNELKKQAPEAKGADKQIEAITADKARAKKFYEETSWEEGFKPFVESLMMRGKSYEDYKAASAKITTFDTSAEYVNASNKANLATSASRVEKAGSAFEAGKELLQLGDPAEAAKDKVRKGLNEMRDAAKTPVLLQRINALYDRLDAGTAVGSEADVYRKGIAELEAEAKDLRTPIPDEYYGTMMGASRRPGRERTAEEINASRIFQSVAEGLKPVLEAAIRDGMQGANVNAQVTTDPASGSQPRASEQLQGGGT